MYSEEYYIVSHRAGWEVQQRSRDAVPKPQQKKRPLGRKREERSGGSGSGGTTSGGGGGRTKKGAGVYSIISFVL